MSAADSIGAGGDPGREHGQFDVGGVSNLIPVETEKHCDDVVVVVVIALSTSSLSLSLHRLLILFFLSLPLPFKNENKTGRRGRRQRALLRKPSGRRHGL